MTMFRVLAEFYDLQDGGRRYVTGDTFPRDGLSVDAARLEQLATSNNRLGYPLIEKVEAESSELEKPRRGRKAKTDA